jgi:hypothetical protein
MYCDCVWLTSFIFDADKHKMNVGKHQCMYVSLIGVESVPVVSVKTVPCEKGSTVLVEYRDRTCEIVSWHITLYLVS